MAEQGKTVRERTCIGCGKRLGKGELLRIVHPKGESVCFDPTGRKAGRGAYVCSVECFEDAVARNKVARALKTSIGTDEVELIASDMRAAQQGANAR